MSKNYPKKSDLSLNRVGTTHIFVSTLNFSDSLFLMYLGKKGQYDR